jgi:hypothetical protein
MHSLVYEADSKDQHAKREQTCTDIGEINETIRPCHRATT